MQIFLQGWRAKKKPYHHPRRREPKGSLHRTMFDTGYVGFCAPPCACVRRLSEDPSISPCSQAWWRKASTIRRLRAHKPGF